MKFIKFFIIKWVTIKRLIWNLLIYYRLFKIHFSFFFYIFLAASFSLLVNFLFMGEQVIFLTWLWAFLKALSIYRCSWEFSHIIYSLSSGTDEYAIFSIDFFVLTSFIHDMGFFWSLVVEMGRHMSTRAKFKLSMGSIFLLALCSAILWPETVHGKIKLGNFMRERFETNFVVGCSCP